MNTLKFTLPASLNFGSQRITIGNPSGETISTAAAFNVNWNVSLHRRGLSNFSLVNFIQTGVEH
jgi:hypothetical protein